MDTPIVPQKRCKKCKQLKPVTEFYKEKRVRDGLQAKCRSCESERLAAWNDKHRDKFRELRRNWRKGNPEKVREIKRRHYRNNSATVLKSNANRAANKRLLPNGFTELDWDRALNYFNGACAYCGRGVSLFDRHKVLHQEHHIPLSKGGGYTSDNIVPACQSCNFSKSDCDPAEWCIDKFGKRMGTSILERITQYFLSTKES